jgi:hypothetical protein
MNQVTNPEPDAFVLPRGTEHKKLRCNLGWSDKTSREFKENEFEWLELRGGAGQEFNIPDLGEKVKLITELHLDAWDLNRTNLQGWNVCRFCRTQKPVSQNFLEKF